MTLANRMGQAANHVSRLAIGACAALVATGVLGVSRQTVQALEKGRYDPSLPLAFRISRLFGRPIEAIFVQ